MLKAILFHPVFCGDAKMKFCLSPCWLFTCTSLSLLVIATQAENSSDPHYLISYRQYSVLLDEAPQCFQTGCGKNTTLETASSSCLADSPCYTLWNIIQDRFQPEWCRKSPKDIACRIPGWPVLNATAICDLVPDTWIFFTNGECCTNSEEPFEIAKWIGDMCDGEWKTPFGPYGGMAKEDWKEWTLPMNWTVRPENGTTGIATPASCPTASQQLGVFAAVEILLLLTGAIPVYKYLKERRNRRPGQPQVIRHHGLMVNVAALWHRKTGGRFLEFSTIQWIVVGIVAAGFKIGLEFFNSYLIHRTPGYEHVPLAELAILHGTRPRLQWILCLLALINHQVFANASASFGLCELILQIYGIKYFGVTANKGRQRGFYMAHHLRPFWHGRAAYRMYIGALLLLLGLFAIILTWIFFIGLLDIFLVFCGETKRWTETQATRLQRWLNPNSASQTPYNSLTEKPKPVRNWLRGLLPSRFRSVYGNVMRWEDSRVSNYHSSSINPEYENLGGQGRPVDTFRRLREKIVYLVLFVGMCSFSAQWIFWDGFVKAAGPR